MEITGVIETHIHADHYSSARKLAATCGAKLYYGPAADVVFAHQTFEDGAVLEVGNRKIRALSTPGHTREHIALVVDDWFVLTGDTLFVGDVGRVDLTLEESSRASQKAFIKENAITLYQSLQRLLALPDWTEVYAAHYGGSVCGRGIDTKPASTIGRERLKNKPLRLSQDDFVQFQLENTPPVPENFAAIKQHNMGENSQKTVG